MVKPRNGETSERAGTATCERLGIHRARIPSRLGEPGSLFSRYKFLQLELVVVTLLTRTRRELLKRLANDQRAYIFGGFLKPRVTRRPTTSFLFILASTQPPLSSSNTHSSLYSPFILFFFRLLINEPLSLASLSLSLSLCLSFLQSHSLQRRSISEKAEGGTRGRKEKLVTTRRKASTRLVVPLQYPAELLNNSVT